MSTATRTVTINAAFLAEIKDDNTRLHELLTEVAAVCREVAPLEINWKELTETLAELRDQVALHFTLEEAYGYFDDPLEAPPRICVQADRLRSQHGSLYTTICRIADLADELRHQTSPQHSAMRAVVGQFQSFSDQMAEHEKRERDLIWQASFVDLGAGD